MADKSPFLTGGMISLEDAVKFGTTPGITSSTPVKPVPKVTGLPTPEPTSVYQPIDTNFGSPSLVNTNNTAENMGIGRANAPKYEVNKYRYPETLGNKADQQHSMIFYINVRGASKWLNEETAKPITPVGQNRISAAGGVNAGSIGIGATIGGAVGGIANKVISNIGGGKSTIANIIGDVAQIGTTIGGAVGFKSWNEKNNLFKPDQSFRITDAIQLAINKKPSVTYGVQYDNEDLGTLVGWLAGGTSASDMARGNGMNQDLIRAALMTTARVPGAIGNIFGANVDFASALQVGTATAPNPFREQVFRNVQTREFVFDYLFLPQSASEAKNVRDIIYQFKLHMHPEISKDGLFYVYPSTFDIMYMYKGQQNLNLNKISTCVLESMEVDYGGQAWHTFSDGMPTEINMRLKFRELEVMTKERIEKGY